MLTGIIILIAALILAVAIAAMFRGKKRGAFDVETRNPNEFESPVKPSENYPKVHKTEFDLNDRGEEGTTASRPASPIEFESPVAPTNADNTRVSKNEFDLNDKGEEGTIASHPANPNEFDLKDEGTETDETKNTTDEPPKQA
jgi:hypothetical protein